MSDVADALIVKIRSRGKLSRAAVREESMSMLVQDYSSGKRVVNVNVGAGVQQR